MILVLWDHFQSTHRAKLRHLSGDLLCDRLSAYLTWKVAGFDSGPPDFCVNSTRPIRTRMCYSEEEYIYYVYISYVTYLRHSRLRGVKITQRGDTLLQHTVYKGCRRFHTGGFCALDFHVNMVFPFVAGCARHWLASEQRRRAVTSSLRIVLVAACTPRQSVLRRDRVITCIELPGTCREVECVYRWVIYIFRRVMRIYRCLSRLLTCHYHTHIHTLIKARHTCATHQSLSLDVLSNLDSKFSISLNITLVPAKFETRWYIFRVIK